MVDTREIWQAPLLRQIATLERIIEACAESLTAAEWEDEFANEFVIVDEVRRARKTMTDDMLHLRRQAERGMVE